jgi:hypothetical protein
VFQVNYARKYRVVASETVFIIILPTRGGRVGRMPFPTPSDSRAFTFGLKLLA